jgi:hypothetical protein
MTGVGLGHLHCIRRGLHRPCARSAERFLVKGPERRRKPPTGALRGAGTGATLGPQMSGALRTTTVPNGLPSRQAGRTVEHRPMVRRTPDSPSHGTGHGLHLVLARKTVSAAHRCTRTMTCRPLLDTDAACGRQPLLYSAPSLLESS